MLREMESLIIPHSTSLEERSRNLLELFLRLFQKGTLKEQCLCRQQVEEKVEEICLRRWRELCFLPFLSKATL